MSLNFTRLTRALGALVEGIDLACPETGGDTLWASSFAAYDALSDRLKTLLEGLTATHDFTRSFPLKRFGLTEAERQRWNETWLRNPPLSHPMVRIHPESGRKDLFVNEGFITRLSTWRARCIHARAVEPTDTHVARCCVS